MCFAPLRRALFRHLNLQKWREHVVLCKFWLRNALRATTACTFSTSQLPKVVRQWLMVCFVHSDLEMCFAPQRRALFRHLNFQQKWSENGVLCTFWLSNVLRATTACTFSTSQLPKVVREWCALYILTSKCASRHNGVQFFISHLASWLRTRRFSEPTFRPSGATNHWKNAMFRDFPTFSRLCIFFLLTLSLLLFSLLIFLFSLPLPCSAFHLSILSEVWLLNFLRWFHCVASVTSSTAQGGGGSFKNSQPIGEVGCCDSGMAERSHWWTERCLRLEVSSLSLSFSDYLPTYLPIYLSIDLSIYISLSLFHLITLLSIYLPIYLSIYLSFFLYLSLSSVYLSSCLSVYLSIYLSFFLYFSLSSVYLSSCLSVYLSIYLSVYLWCSVIQCNVV